MNRAMEGCPNQTTYYNTTIGEIAVPEWEAILTITTLTIIIVLTIIGNILVILSIFTHKPLRIVQNFFIVSLAVADLTVAILVMPFNIAYSTLGQWSFGTPACKLWVTADVLCCTASILNLCMIALDRFWAITDPLNYATKRTLKRVLYFITGIWVLSLVISSPPLFWWKYWHTTAETICELTQTQGYVVYSALGSFFIPLAIMGIVYVQIYFAMRRRLRERANTLHKSMTHGGTLKMKKIDKEPEKGPYEAVQGGTGPNFVERFIQEKQKISLSMERRAARVLGIVMGVFVVCWLPFFLMYVINPFCSSCCPTSRLKNFITWLGYVNSTLNPIIYTIFNKDFRTAFKRLLGMKT